MITVSVPVSDWPTFPQVYFKGDFIGGCDIMMQMHQSGENSFPVEILVIKA